MGAVRSFDILSLQIFGIIPAFLYIFFGLCKKISLAAYKINKKQITPFPFLIFVYLLCYIFIYFFINDDGLSVAKYVYAFILIVNFIFWHTMLNDNFYLCKKKLFYKDFFTSLYIAFFFRMIFDTYNCQFQIGGFYASVKHNPFLITSLDSPFLAGVCAIISIAYLVQIIPSISKKITKKYTRKFSLCCLILLLISASFLLLINRLGPMIGFVIALVVMPFIKAFNKIKTTNILLMSFIFIPLMWEIYLGHIFLRLSETKLFNLIVYGKSSISFIEASGRIEIWKIGLEYLSNFQIKSLFGYGRFTSLFGGSETLITHMHNTYLQIFIEIGLIGVIIVFVMFLLSSNKLSSIVKISFHRSEIKALYGIFLFIIVTLTTESLLIMAHLTHIFVVSILLIIHNEYCILNIKNKRSGL